jgi:hypothetical protein
MQADVRGCNVSKRKKFFSEEWIKADFFINLLSARHSVQSFAQQVCMAIVSRVLLDHMDIYPPQVHFLIGTWVDERLVEVPTVGCRPSQLDLPDEQGEVLFRVSIVRMVESAVWVRFGAMQPPDVLAGESHAEPDTLHVGHMPHEAK